MDANTAPLSAVLLCDRHTSDEIAVEPWTARPEGQRALDHLAARIEPQVDDVVLVTLNPLALFRWNGLIAAPNSARPSLLEALYTGLKLVRHHQVLVTAIKVPWLQPEVFHLLRAALQPRWDAILPQVAGRSMAFPAFYTKGCLHRIELHLERNVTGISALLEKLRFRPVSEKKLRQADRKLLSFMVLEEEGESGKDDGS